MLNKAKDWVLARLPERTSWDGATLIAVCGLIVRFGGGVKLLAWAGLAWGIYTLVAKEG